MPGSVIVNQPGVYFVDVDGNLLSADDGTTISDHEGILIAGKDGTTLRFMRVAADGTLRIDPTGTTVQPISATSFPLPAGAATEATLATLATESKLEAVRALVASLDGKDFATQTTLSSLLTAFNAEDFASETKLEAVRALLATIDADTSSIAAEDFATQTTLEAVRVLLVSIAAEDYATETTLSAVNTALSDGTQLTKAVGEIAHDAADSGAPVKIGGTATSATATPVNEGDRVQASFDLEGRLRTTTTGGGGGGLTDAELRAAPVPVEDGGGSLTVDGPLTDAELRASAVPVSAASLPLPSGAATEATVAGLLTDTELRATAVPVSGPLTDAELRASAVPVSAASLPLPSGAATETTLATRATEATVAGLLTDTELRASPVPISDGAGSITVDGPLTDAELRATSVPVSGPLTDAELRASAVPVSNASLPLPSGAATETTLATLATEVKLETVRVLLASIDGKDFATETTQATLATEAKLEAVRVILASLDAKDYATQTTLAAILVDTGQIETLLGTIDADTSVLAATDFATQTTLAAILVDTGQIEALLTTIDADTSVLAATDFSTETTLATKLSKADFETRINTLGQKAMAASTPMVIASDQSEVASKNAAASQVDGHSASIGATADADTANTVIGRLKQVITRLAGGLPASLVGGRLDQNLGAWLGSTAPTVGQKAMASSVPVTISSDQATFPVTTTPGPPPPGVVSGLVFGQVVSGGSNLVDVLDTSYVQPTANAQRSIRSSSANDAAAGTGARTVRITYLNSTMTALLTEDVTLSGLTWVDTVATDIRFIEKIEVLTVGSTNSNVGTITLNTGTAGGGTAIGSIAATRVRTFWAHHYIRDGKTLFLASMNGGAKVKEGGQFWGILSRPLTANSAPIQVTPAFALAGLQSSVTITFATPISVVNGPARLRLQVDAAGNDTFFCGFAFTEGE